MRDQSPMGIAYAEFVERTYAGELRADLLSVIERVERDRYTLSGSSPDYRRGWRECADHTLRWLRQMQGQARVVEGLRELAACDVVEIDFSEVEG